MEKGLMTNKWIKTIILVLKWLFISVVILFCLFLLISFISQKIYGTNYPVFFGYSWAYIRPDCGSMLPTIDPGEGIIIRVGHDIEVGDIITYLRDGEMVTHRVIEINGDMITTKGDNPSNSPDVPFNISQVIGEVIFYDESFGVFLRFISSTWFKFGLIAVVAIYLFITWMFGKDDKEGGDNEKETKNS